MSSDPDLGDPDLDTPDLDTPDSTHAENGVGDPADATPVRRPLLIGDLVRLEDPKGRYHLVTLAEGKTFYTHRGAIAHDELIGKSEGVVVRTTGGHGPGTPYLAMRPLLADYVPAMKRGATVIYPKDAAQIAGAADVFPGAVVVEAGAGSGGLTCTLLRAVGEEGTVVSYERREDFAAIARTNVERFFGGPHPAWRLVVDDLLTAPSAADVDRVILDMLAPWECVDWAAGALVPGGVFCCYVATTTQLSRVVETVRQHRGFTEPQSWETMVRSWHVEGLAVRPNHRMVGHTGFLMTTRRLAPGVDSPRRRRRPAPGAYGAEYEGPGT